MLELHAAFLALVVGSEAFFTALAVVNLRHGERRVHEESDWLADELGIDDPARLLAYRRARTGIGALEAWTVVGAVLVLLYTGVVGDAARVVVGAGLGPIAGGALFLAAVAAAFAALHLPFDVVRTFVVEEIFGFNRKTLASWMRDTALKTAIGVGLAALLGAGLLALIGWRPATWWLLGTGLYLAVALVGQVAFPRVIAPLFHDFEPVADPALRDAVRDVCEQAGVAVDRIQVVDASRRSTHKNAYFAGIGGSRKVVLYDTLVDELSIPKIQAIVAHEVTHWREGHVLRKTAVGTAQVLVGLAALHVLLQMPWLYAMFGLPVVPAVGLFVGGLWLSPLARFASPVSSHMSIRYEREADDGAVDLVPDGTALADALRDLTGDNLSNPFPHPLHAAFHGTHPPLPERIERIRRRAGEGDVS